MWKKVIVLLAVGSQARISGEEICKGGRAYWTGDVTGPAQGSLTRIRLTCEDT